MTRSASDHVGKAAGNDRKLLKQLELKFAVEKSVTSDMNPESEHDSFQTPTKSNRASP